ncbi:hypothetical protein AWJ20_3370 [Sugiyamaella lignohabitans]|uniref:2-dehydropantoate 2-reductase n=1 Tax=Sugiyamaella lignohabitans TaxID=796027 RepID=A0A161HHX3_9ASCO|nr:uncharacterized protein AWJ20_3370 [Sugiyamaella lignohabitans]ANB15730.1 hypothetical protein AWJ20_3370 [Sugiyamaella lignohabitans]
MLQGLVLNSIHFGDVTFRPDGVYKSPMEASEHEIYDYVICTNKALDPSALPGTLAPVVTPEVTTIVLIQNGVGSEIYLTEAFSKNTVITCVTWVGAKQDSPGVIEHNNGDQITMGVAWNKNLDRIVEEKKVETFATILRNGGTGVQVDDDIIARRWEKVVWNAAWNSFTALTMLNTQQFLNSSEEAIVISRRLMTEIIDVAKAQGIGLEYKLVDELIDKTLKSHGLVSSMMMDLKNNRPMEVEGILGNPMRAARKFGVATPTLDLAYVLVKAQNWRVTNPSKV